MCACTPCVKDNPSTGGSRKPIHSWCILRRRDIYSSNNLQQRITTFANQCGVHCLFTPKLGIFWARGCHEFLSEPMWQLNLSSQSDCEPSKNMLGLHQATWMASNWFFRFLLVKRCKPFNISIGRRERGMGEKAQFSLQPGQGQAMLLISCFLLFSVKPEQTA